MRFYSIILSPLLPSFFAAKPFLFLLYFLLSRSVAEHYNETQSLCMAFVSPRWLNMPNKSLFCTFSSCIKLCVFFLSDGSFVNAGRKLLSKTAKEKKELFESDVIESEGGENKTLLESESSSSGSQNTVSHFLV